MILADATVDALHGARGMAATVPSVGGQAAFDEVFLSTVKHALQVTAAVVVAARHQDLRFRDERWKPERARLA